MKETVLEDEKISKKNISEKEKKNLKEKDWKSNQKKNQNKQSSNMKENKKTFKEKKRIMINGYSLWRLLAYFIIYSFLGYVVETIYGIIRDGVWESRQSFMFGPFCGIYGLGAIVMIVALKNLKQNFHTMFLAGAVIGSVVEYMVSWIGELLFNVRWWDYSDQPLNINGRICVLYAVFWGILATYLVLHLNPKIDKIIDWIKSKLSTNTIRVIVIVMFFTLVIDALMSSYGVAAFMIRTIIDYNIDVEDKDRIQALYDDMYGNEQTAKFIEKYFSDETMLMIFPRLKVQEKDGNVIYFSEIMPNIDTYYAKIWEGSDEWESQHKLLMNKQN